MKPNDTTTPKMLEYSRNGCFCIAFGNYFAERNKQVEETAAAARLQFVPLGVAVATVAFVIFFVTIAIPPL